MSDPLFSIGELTASPEAMQAILNAENSLLILLERHTQGDWGQVSEDAAEWNDTCLKDGGPLQSVYVLSTGVTVWIFTSSDRSSTTIMLPNDS